MYCLHGSSASAQADFLQQTAGPPGGIVQDLVIRSDGSLFVVQEKELFRSLDDGRTWQPLRFEEDVYALALDASGVLWAGTATGIARSLDAGTTWERGGLANRRVRDLTYSGTAGYFALSDTTIFRSDDGIAWEATPSMTASPRHYPVRFVESTESGAVFAANGPGPLGGGSLNQWADSLWVSQVRGIFTSVAARGDVVYAGAVRTMYDRNGLYRSSDGGTTWTRLELAPGINSEIRSLLWNEEGLFVGTSYDVHYLDPVTGWTGLDLGRAANRLAIHPDGSLYAGTIRACGMGSVDTVPGSCGMGGGVFNFTGQSWQVLDVPEAHAAIRAMAWDSEQTVYAAAMQGIYKTTDEGATWERAVPYLREDQAIYDTILNFYRTSGGVFLIQGDDGLYRHTPSDTSWQYVFDFYFGRAFEDLVEHPDGQLFAALSDFRDQPGGVYVSEDEGLTWNALTTASFATFALAVDGTGTLYAGTANGVLRSEDEGASWQETGLQGQHIDAVQVTRDGQYLAALKDHYGRELYRSHNEGQTWEALPDSTSWIDKFVLEESGNLFITNNQGVDFVHRDSTSWTSVATFEEHNLIGSLLVGPQGYLYVGRFGQGVWRSTHPARAVANEPAADVPRHIALGQNYPNPFNPSTTIPFTLQRPAHITIDIVDVLGRVVAKLVDGEWPLGTHAATWEAQDVPSGLYFYRLRTAHSLDVRKMTLIQ